MSLSHFDRVVHLVARSRGERGCFPWEFHRSHMRWGFPIWVFQGRFLSCSSHFYNRGKDTKRDNHLAKGTVVLFVFLICMHLQNVFSDHVTEVPSCPVKPQLLCSVNYWTLLWCRLTTSKQRKCGTNRPASLSVTTWGEVIGYLLTLLSKLTLSHFLPFNSTGKKIKMPKDTT